MDAGQSFHLVHVYDDTITHAVVPVVDRRHREYFSAEWAERMARSRPHERLEAFSRKPTDPGGNRRAVQPRCTQAVPRCTGSSDAPRVGSRHPLTSP